MTNRAFHGLATPAFRRFSSAFPSTNSRGFADGRSARSRASFFHPGNLLLVFTLGVAFVASHVSAATTRSIARIWDEEILSAIRIDLPHPPVHARNLFHFSVVMYDAWAAYDPVAVGYVYRSKHTAPDLSAARREAISFAAYRLLTERYALSRNAAVTLDVLAARMAALGYDKDNRTLDPASPAGVGNRVAVAASAFFLEDGSRQSVAYQDLPLTDGGYIPANPPLITGLSGTLAIDVNHWQQLVVTNAVSQNNIPVDAIQKFLGAHWRDVRPFALARTEDRAPWIDPGPPPQLGGAGHARFRDDVVEIIRRSSELTPDDGVTMDFSPGAFGNNSLGANDGSGHAVNPATGRAYAPNRIKRGDFARVLAEFWADGPQSETPPGHWNSLANSVSDHPDFAPRIGGNGPVLDALEWDVKLYFALNAAVHDAACVAWTLKRHYNGGRPITFIRFMGQLGQSSEPGGFSYHVSGLPLVPDLIEVVTPETARLGGRHSGYPIGAVVIRAWPGQPVDPATEHSGTRWILASTWLPFQKKNFVTPAFPGYVSGHSTFSRAAAEVLAAITGSPFFPGGLGTFTAPANRFLTFERGPSTDVQLQWGTYYDAADQAGLSRLWGGIHVAADDGAGRTLGAQCGRGAWALARRYFDGSILETPATLAIRSVGPGKCEIRYDTLRGFYYKLQSASSLAAPFTDEPGGFFQALNSSAARIESEISAQKFYRVLRTHAP